MRVLVTGGAGFIGSSLVPVLLADGHQVSVIDDLSVGAAERVPPGADLIVQDILDPTISQTIAELSPDAVVHLAAQTSVVASVADPEFDRRVNLEGTRVIARASAAAGASRLVFSSTAAVYGEPSEIPLRESARTDPLNPYGASKLEAEAALVHELDKGGVEHVTLRLANVYGPGQDVAGEGGVVAIFANLAMAGESLPIYGDGEQTRDFVYVGDVVAALGAALTVSGPLPSSGNAIRVFNISTGVETSVLEIARLVCEAAGVSLDLHMQPPRPGDIVRSALDPARAAEVLGWRANTPLGDGVATTLAALRLAR